MDQLAPYFLVRWVGTCTTLKFNTQMSGGWVSTRYVTEKSGYGWLTWVRATPWMGHNPQPQKGSPIPENHSPHMWLSTSCHEVNMTTMVCATTYHRGMTPNFPRNILLPASVCVVKTKCLFRCNCSRQSVFFGVIGVTLFPFWRHYLQKTAFRSKQMAAGGTATSLRLNRDWTTRKHGEIAIMELFDMRQWKDSHEYLGES